ncbi:hypothetical protein [Cecembia rubra]|uniref:6-bladed beta-propeller protein n=1 Tax=Cecembia rubra TaxID=1485585 RepID=A0A2P8E7Z9_9BACT|nr:hypothetical protein [Cecembia rubra]PSL05528.1 hypothetical protein CLV48_10338 [Cecembia rubra]
MVGKIYVFLVCFVVFILACSRKEIDPNNYPINIQNEDLIVLKERDFLDTLKLINSFVFFGEPLGFSVERGEIYVLELFSKDFYRLSANGEILAKYPIGNGEGPNELLNPINFFYQKGNLDIVDVGTLAVKRYSIANQNFELKDNLKVKSAIYKMLKIGNEEYLFITSKKQGLDFRIIDYKGNSKSIEFINELFFPIDAAGMHYDGRIKVFRDKIYYFLMGNSKFLCFNKDRLEFIGEMIHRVPRRNIQTAGNMIRVVSFETAVFDFDVDSKYIYLLSGVPYKNLGKDSFSLDLYDATNGKYLHSYHLPFHSESEEYLPQGIKVDGEMIYVQFEEGAFAVFEKPKH